MESFSYNINLYIIRLQFEYIFVLVYEFARQLNNNKYKLIDPNGVHGLRSQKTQIIMH